METEFLFKPLDKNAILPVRHSEGAAGYDLHSVLDGIVPAHTIVTVGLGFTMELPKNIIGYLCGRSGLASKNGINIINSFIRNGDKEVIIHIENTSDHHFTFEKGMRIAQVFFAVIDDSDVLDSKFDTEY